MGGVLTMGAMETGPTGTQHNSYSRELGIMNMFNYK